MRGGRWRKLRGFPVLSFLCTILRTGELELCKLGFFLLWGDFEINFGQCRADGTPLEGRMHKSLEAKEPQNLISLLLSSEFYREYTHDIPHAHCP